MDRVAPHAGHVVALVQHLAPVPGEGEHHGAARGVEGEAHEALLGAHLVGQQGGQVGVGLASVTDLLFGKKVGGRNGLRHGNLFLDMIFFIFLKYKIKIKKKIGPTVMHCFKIRC